MLIEVVILADSIDEVDPIPNCMLIMPYVVILNYTPVSSLWNAKNWPYFAVDFLDVPVSIIMSMKLSAI